MAQDTAMESTPDSGVAIIKDKAAPLLAPCFLRPVATGTTPQEHKGMGIPKSAAKMTGFILPVPRYCFILSALKKTYRIPATKNQTAYRWQHQDKYARILLKFHI